MIILKKTCFMILSGFIILISLAGYTQNTVIDSLKLRLNETEGEEKIKALIGLSYHHLRISTIESLKYSTMACEYSKETGNVRGVARALLMMGNGESTAGNYSKAIDYQQQALHIFKSIMDTAAMGITYNNLGINYHNLGLYSTAIDQYQSSYSIAKNLSNDVGLFYSLNNIGTIYEDWGKNDLALEHYQSALQFAQKINNKNYEAIALHNIGVAKSKLGNYEMALEYLNNSLVLRNELNDHEGIFKTLINLGEIQLKINHVTEAIARFHHALSNSIEDGNKVNIAEASLKLGKSYLLTNEYEKAGPLLEKAMKLSKDAGETKYLHESYKSLSDYCALKNDFENAYKYYLEHTILKDSIFNRDSRREISEMQTLYELDKKEKEIEIQNLKIGRQKAGYYYTISGVILFLFLAVLLFNRYKLKQKHFRTELEKKNIDIEQRLLRTQMNPHFIFNSLNSINSYISDNNSDAAQSYLTKFARLMRYILENSRKAFVPVADEVNTLRLNMELEQMRFNHKFDFEISIDENIDAESTFIPPMLIQPFVENAIIHGLSPKSGHGKLNIGLTLENNLIHCLIEDDGIGRQQAIKIKEKSGRTKHQSLGMQVTKERLEILNERSKDEIRFEITDLMNDTGVPSGTRVEMTIPCETE